MSNSIYQSPGIAVRLYANPKFGSSMGPNRTNPFLLNGAIEVNHTKLFVDLAQLDHLVQGCDPAASPHMPVVLQGLARLLGHQQGQDANFLAGQFKLVDPDAFLEGGLVLNMRTRELRLYLQGDDGKMCFAENMTVAVCRPASHGKKSPAYFGTNYQLNTRVPQPPTAATISRANAVLAQLGAMGSGN